MENKHLINSRLLEERNSNGLFKMWDEKGPYEKFLASLSGTPSGITSNRYLLKDIEHFFSIYKELEKKKTGVEGWEDYGSALKIIKESQERYIKQQRQKGAKGE